MTTKTPILKWFLILPLLFVSISSCKKEEPTTNLPTNAIDGITSSQVAMIDNLETDTTTKLSDTKFDDGTSVKVFLMQYDSNFLTQFPSNKSKSTTLTPTEQKKLLLARMQAVAFNLVTRQYHQYSDEGANKPAQNGLAYVYGSKQYQNRQGAVGGCSSELLYGLDCSGMIFQMSKSAGLILSSNPSANCNVSYLSDTSKWNKALKNSSDYTGLYVTNLGFIPINQMEFGDIIVWSGHIGMVLNADTLRIFQSSGYSDISLCQKNTDIKHGPTIKKLTTGFLGAFGSYKILRIYEGCTWYVGNYTLSNTYSTMCGPQHGETGEVYFCVMHGAPGSQPFIVAYYKSIISGLPNIYTRVATAIPLHSQWTEIIGGTATNPLRRSFSLEGINFTEGISISTIGGSQQPGNAYIQVPNGSGCGPGYLPEVSFYYDLNFQANYTGRQVPASLSSTNWNKINLLMQPGQGWYSSIVE